jgi:hypothetical protein
MKNARAHESMKVGNPKSERDQDQSRGQRKPNPRRDCTKNSCSVQSHGDSYLATSGARQKLAKSNQIGIRVFVQPSPTLYKFVMEKSEMGYGSTKGGQPQAKKN